MIVDRSGSWGSGGDPAGPNGPVAEWLGSGLQIRVRGFESHRGPLSKHTKETGMEDGQGQRPARRGGDSDAGRQVRVPNAGGPAVADKRYCPVTGQFEDHAAQACCDDPIMHIMPVEDIMDAYRRIAQQARVMRMLVEETCESLRLLELADELINSVHTVADRAWMARRDRFNGQYAAHVEKTT